MLKYLRIQCVQGEEEGSKRIVLKPWHSIQLSTTVTIHRFKSIFHEQLSAIH